MRTPAAAAALLLGATLATPAHAEGPKVHRLEATPSTIAYGYYWAAAKPVLRIASGDSLDVDTLLTNTPAGLQKAGVADDRIQGSLKAIVAEVTGDRRGPGGHILTGPVYVEGAEPGDVLEVKILAIDFPIDYGYNGCSGFLPENCDRSLTSRIIPLHARTMTADFAPGIVIPLHPFFGSIGVAPAPELGRVSSNPPGRHAAISTTRSWASARRCSFRSSRRARCSRSATATPRRATARSIRRRSRRRCAAASSSPSART